MSTDNDKQNASRLVTRNLQKPDVGFLVQSVNNLCSGLEEPAQHAGIVGIATEVQGMLL